MIQIQTVKFPCFFVHTNGVLFEKDYNIFGVSGKTLFQIPTLKVVGEMRSYEHDEPLTIVELVEKLEPLNSFTHLYVLDGCLSQSIRSLTDDKFKTRFALYDSATQKFLSDVKF